MLKTASKNVKSLDWQLINDETWLIGRRVDASKKNFVAMRILVFDFELFKGGQRQLRPFGRRRHHQRRDISIPL